jgi:hypothetical protein
MTERRYCEAYYKEVRRLLRIIANLTERLEAKAKAHEQACLLGWGCPRQEEPMRLPDWVQETIDELTALQMAVRRVFGQAGDALVEQIAREGLKPEARRWGFGKEKS